MMRFLVGVLFVTIAGCNGNGHVEQKPFVVAPTDDVVNCNCNLTFNNEHCTGGTCYEHFDIQMCIPPALKSAADFKGAMDTYCRQTITPTVYHLIRVINGGWCDYKAPFAPNGGIGSSVDCFAQPLGDKMSATARDDGTCDTQCQAVTCDHLDCSPGVQDWMGNPDLNKCKCSQLVTEGSCPGDNPADLPTPVFCRPPDNVSLQ